MTDKEQLNLMLILKHKEEITQLMSKFAAEISYRSGIHDNSKFSPEEFDVYSSNVQDFNKYDFDSEEEKRLRERVYPAAKAHQKRNRHHPEHFKNGIDDMNLIDLLEMICDWKSASSRAPGDSLRKGLPILKEKYKISPQLYQILTNTIKDFNMY